MKSNCVKKNELLTPTSVDIARLSVEIRDDDPSPGRRHPVAAYLASLGASSRRTQTWAINLAARILSGGASEAQSLRWELVRHPDVVALRAYLAGHYRAATANRILAAVRKTLRAALVLGLIDGESCARTVDVEWVPSDRKFPPGRIVSRGELEKVFSSCAHDGQYDSRRVRGAQDAAAIAVLYGCRLREIQLCALSLDDYRVTGGSRGSIVVRNRASRKNLVHLPRGADDALTDWLAIRGLRPGPLFPALTAERKLSDRPLSAPALRQRLRRRARTAGIAAFTPRDLRHSWTWDMGAALDVPFLD